ncbi:hypothetical protein QE152_g35900 [Popillia japonica]|uniref:Uncharacterized protein n=1 Tax=Popillia japonica TaxID=7064 RepID=A0AAW1IEC1_POPJA
MSYVLEEENFNYFVKQPSNINRTEFKPMKQHTPLNQNAFNVQKPITQNIINPNRFVPQFNQYQNQVTQQPIQQPRPYQASAFNTPQLRPQFSQHGQWRPQTSKPPSFKFAKSPGQLQDRQQAKSTPMELGSLMTRTQKPTTSNQFRMNNKPNWSSGQLYHQTDEINAS